MLPCSVRAPCRSRVRAVLAEGWREDCSLGATLWALGELFGEAFAARMPQGRLPAFGL